MANGDIAKGFVLGAAAVLIGRAVLKSVPAGAQPLAHALLRGGAIIAEKAREAAAELGEVFEDTLAELQASQRNPPPATDSAPVAPPSSSDTPSS
jgi:hypothetical protein